MSKYTVTKTVTGEDTSAILRDMAEDMQAMFDKYVADTAPNTRVMMLMQQALASIGRDDMGS